MPADTADIERCEPVYKVLPGWEEDIAGVTDFAKLPQNAQDYVLFIENYLGVRVTMIGTGADNADLIRR
jgi:adenylosuccinate synthase